MSDIGVHSNVYGYVREYGQLIDDVLIGLRAGTGTHLDARARQLGELLSGLGAGPSSLEASWLSMSLGLIDPKRRADLALIGQALLAGEVSERVIGGLEDLAFRIEERRTDALAKMRGTHG